VGKKLEETKDPTGGNSADQGCRMRHSSKAQWANLLVEIGTALVCQGGQGKKTEPFQAWRKDRGRPTQKIQLMIGDGIPNLRGLGFAPIVEKPKWHGTSGGVFFTSGRPRAGSKRAANLPKISRGSNAPAGQRGTERRRPLLTTKTPPCKPTDERKPPARTGPSEPTA